MLALISDLVRRRIYCAIFNLRELLLENIRWNANVRIDDWFSSLSRFGDFHVRKVILGRKFVHVAEVRRLRISLRLILILNVSRTQIPSHERFGGRGFICRKTNKMNACRHEMKS